MVARTGSQWVKSSELTRLPASEGLLSESFHWPGFVSVGFMRGERAGEMRSIGVQTHALPAPSCLLTFYLHKVRRNKEREKILFSNVTRTRAPRAGPSIPTLSGASDYKVFWVTSSRTQRQAARDFLVAFMRIFMSLTVFEADAKPPKLSRLECNQVGRAEASATATGRSQSRTWREHVGVLRIAE